MITIHTPMPLFNKPGSMPDMLAERGWQAEWLFSRSPVKGKPTPEEAQRALMERADEIVYLLLDTTRITREFLAKAGKLKLIAMFGVGLDHIDIPAATEKGVLVTNVPGGNSRCVAELVLGMMLNLAHKITPMHTHLAAGVWRPRSATELAGKTLGVVGLGRAGTAVARLGRALDMTLVGTNRTPKPDLAAELGLTLLPLDETLSRADYLSIHVPGGYGSYRLGATELARMKPTACLINAARGDALDLDALIVALEENRLAGAGLDVFPQEPMPADHPVFRMSQVVCTPHAGGLSQESMKRVCASCLEEVTRVAAGERSPNARNPEVYGVKVNG
jgi:D-3-phosphoglycerate dehydrogenase